MPVSRVFLSYSRQDRALVESLAAILRAAGIDPLWDRDLIPGLPFNDQIEAYIEHAHVFAPVITPAEAGSMWVHGEIGYALALRIPVLPICVGGVPPTGMIQTVQAVVLHSPPEDHAALIAEAGEKLTAAAIDHLSHQSAGRPALFECTEDNARRAGLLAAYAARVTTIGRSGRVRQKATLGSFHLPLLPATHRVWESLYGRSASEARYLYDQLLAERQALAVHARGEGCRLIIDSPEAYARVYDRHAPGSAAARCRALLAFLESDEVTEVEVAVNDDPERKSSLTIVGDWFSSEAISSGERANLREAIFTRDAATVRRQIAEFDDEFARLLAARGWQAGESRKAAAGVLRGWIGHEPA